MLLDIVHMQQSPADAFILHISRLQICIEGPTGIKLRECADKVIGLKQEMTIMKQNMKAQASTQDSLRAAVSHLDKQVQVLPSTLAKQLAHPAEQLEALPKTKPEAADRQQQQQQQQQAEQAEIAEKQLTSWSQALEQQSDSEATLAARAAFLQQVPLSRQLLEKTTQKPAAAAAASDVSTSQQQPQPAVSASVAGPTVPPVTVVQVCFFHVCLWAGYILFIHATLTPCLYVSACFCNILSIGTKWPYKQAPYYMHYQICTTHYQICTTHILFATATVQANPKQQHSDSR